MKSNTKIIYLVAMPFSGTTLLSRLMSFHPDIATVGEMRNVLSESSDSGYICSCGQLLTACPFWLGVKDKMDRTGHGLSLYDFELAPPGFISGLCFRLSKLASAFIPQDRIADLIRRFLAGRLVGNSRLSRRIQAFSQCVVEQSGKCIFFDASKDPDLIFYLAASDVAELVFIHMVRDPRGVSMSMMKNLSRRSFTSCISEWVSMNYKIEWLLSLFPNIKTIRVRYEDLCNDPQKFMSALYQDVGAFPFNIEPGGKEQSHIIGNRMRLTALEKISQDDNWRRTLKAEDEQIAKKIAGEIASRFGYTL